MKKKQLKRRINALEIAISKRVRPTYSKEHNVRLNFNNGDSISVPLMLPAARLNDVPGTMKLESAEVVEISTGKSVLAIKQDVTLMFGDCYQLTLEVKI